MKLAIFSIVLNQHQAPVADALWEQTGHQFAFVELANHGSTKGGTKDYSTRPYLIRAWESPEAYAKAMELARTAEVCIFSCAESLPFEKERMRLGLLSFDMSERWLKHGWKNLASPRLLKWLMAYHIGGWGKKPLYKLCMSAFAAGDHYRLRTFKDKCYKWGYFTSVEASEQEVSTEGKVHILWCARFLLWKHPELAIKLIEKVAANGYNVQLDLIGDGPIREKMEALAASIRTKLDARCSINFLGVMPNDEVIRQMRMHDIFLFTSDKNEGWGAVANEAMSSGCCLVASDAIGSVPYLVTHKETGMMFKSCDLESLCEQVTYLLDNPEERKRIAKAGQRCMQEVWSPQNAAKNLLQLIDDLQNGRECSIKQGPCSKAKLLLT